MFRVPHPIPYQGSKRILSSIILDYFPVDIGTLYEPFAGSAAVTLAAMHTRKASAAHINDSLVPLMNLWLRIIETPKELADAYTAIWESQLEDPREYYDKARYEFNKSPSPDKLLFLLARCVKNAVRFNSDGEFNQSPDKRRLGTQPKKMRENILKASSLLRGRVLISHVDYSQVLSLATPSDLVYMDPPYQGTSGQRDTRYHQQLDLDRFVTELELLVERNVPFIISFDGRCGARVYGQELPRRLGLVRVEVHAGRSSQATLNGTSDDTYESLYLSPNLGASSAVKFAPQRSIKESRQLLLPSLDL